MCVGLPPPKKKKKNCTLENPPTPCHLASARQHPENQKGNQASHSSERAVEGPLGCGIALGSQPGSCLLAGHQSKAPPLKNTEFGINHHFLCQVIS